MTGRCPTRSRELQEAARLEPKSGEAHYQLGLALARAGRKEEASAELARGRALVAEDDRTQNASLDIADGQAAMARGALDEAEAKFRRALQLRPDSRDAKRYLDTIATRRKSRIRRSRAGRGGRSVHPAGTVQRGRALARRVSQGAPAVLVGVVTRSATVSSRSSSIGESIKALAGRSSSTSPTPRPTRSSVAT